jgi:hypothetical protein
MGVAFAVAEDNIEAAAEELFDIDPRVFCKCWVWKISGGDSLSLLL